MANRLQLYLDIRVLNGQVMAALETYALRMRHQMGTVLRQQMRLLMLDVVKRTPPFRKYGNAPNESFNDQLRTEQNRISRDVETVFKPIEWLVQDNANLGEAIGKALRQDNMVVAGLKNSLPELLLKAKVIDPTGLDRGDKIVDEPTEAIYEHVYPRRHGSARLPWPVWVKKKSRVKAFIREKWEKIGELKGGWGRGCAAFGPHNLPHWIMRHAAGTAVDRTRQKENPYALARNTVPYMAEHDRDLGIVKQALQDRVRSMENQMAHVAAEPVKL